MILLYESSPFYGCTGLQHKHLPQPAVYPETRARPHRPPGGSTDSYYTQSLTTQSKTPTAGLAIGVLPYWWAVKDSNLRPID